VVKMKVKKWLPWLERIEEFAKKHGSCNLWIDVAILLVFNIIYWSKCLLSGGTIVGFQYQQDAYEHMLNIDYILKLLGKGILPFGAIWFSPVYCGFSKVLIPGPTLLFYIFLFLLTHDFLFSYNLTIFFLYFISSLTMYYLASVFDLDRGARLVSAIAYTFSQFLMLEVLNGHLGVASAMAVIPLIVATSISNSRSSSWKKRTLLYVLISVLIIERPDFAFFTIVFLLIFIPIIIKPPKLKNLLMFFIPLVAASFLAFPYLESSFLRVAPDKLKFLEIYNYIHYSIYPFQLFVPVLLRGEAYLGLSIVSLSMIGTLTIILGLTGRRAYLDNKRLSSLPFLAILFIIIGLGANTPLYGFLCEHVPYFSRFRVPHRWLVIAQLCLALLAGKGATIVVERFSVKKINQLNKKQVKTAFLVLTLAVIFLDLSSFITFKIPEWHGVIEMSGVELFILPQPSDVSQKSEVYEFIRANSGQYRIFVTPTVYSTSYWDYLRYLRNTNITLASWYGHLPSSELQERVYYALRKNNITAQIGEEMALLGVKFVVYDYRRGRWDRLVEQMNSSDDLEFLLDDGSYILYLNKRFDDSWMGFYTVKNLYANVDSLFSEENLVRANGSLWRKNPMELRVKVNITEPCFIILGESFDHGWNIQDKNTQENISILNYRGLLTLSVKRPCYLDLTLKFSTYVEFLKRFIHFNILALIVLIFPEISRLACRWKYDL